MKRLLVIIAVVSIAIGCSLLKRDPHYFWYQFSNTSYQFDEAGWRTTPRGLRLWDPKFELDVTHLDAVVDRVEACWLTMPRPADAELRAGLCSGPWKPEPLHRDRLNFAVAPDWYTSKCTGKAVFPCNVSKADCDQARKDKPELAGCAGPCACRGTVQQMRTIVTTPTMELVPGMLFGLVTSCVNMWHAPFAQCTAPPIP